MKHIDTFSVTPPDDDMTMNRAESSVFKKVINDLLEEDEEEDFEPPKTAQEAMAMLRELLDDDDLCDITDDVTRILTSMLKESQKLFEAHSDYKTLVAVLGIAKIRNIVQLLHETYHILLPIVEQATGE